MTRSEMIEIAKRMATHTWVCKPANRHAECVQNYTVPWKENDTVVGVAYDWGGMDDVDAFDRKLAQGYAAGSHKQSEVSACTAGVDCSGLISLCWGQSRKFGTADIHEISDTLSVNIYRDLKPGDALNKAGTHIVLFAGYNPDGTVNVYEASGSRSRVVLTRTPWVKLKGFVPVRYKATLD